MFLKEKAVHLIEHLSTSSGQAPLLRCQCTETVPKEISDNRIVKLEIIPPGPHCKNTEVM